MLAAEIAARRKGARRLDAKASALEDAEKEDVLAATNRCARLIADLERAHAAELRTHGEALAKTGRDARFTGDNLDGTGDDCTTGAHVGPGSYEPRRTNAGESESMARVSEGLRTAGLHSASMLSESPQRPLAADLW